MKLFDTVKQSVILDAVELIPGIWVHSNGNRHICTDKQIGPVGSGLPYSLLAEDAPEVIKAIQLHKGIERQKEADRIAKEKEAKKKKEQENAARKQEHLKAQEEKKRQEKREKELCYILPKQGEMPKWYTDYKSSFQVKAGKQSEIRETFRYNQTQWSEYFCDSSFPSSFMAGYSIVKDFLCNRFVSSVYNSLQEVTIADIGSGIGGATLGAITAIEEVLPMIRTISIKAYDYSDTALDFFQNCVDQYARHSTIRINTDFNTVHFVTKNSDVSDKNAFTIAAFDRTLLTDSEFDFVFCFKMINELIHSHGFDLKKTYRYMLDRLSPHLSENGCLVILDVYKSAEKDENDNYLDENEYGKELDKQSRTFIRENKNEFGIIVPVPCALINGGCKDDGRCVQIKQFKANGGRIFPATYKVITRRDLARNIINSITHHQPNEYIISRNKDGQESCCGNNGNNQFRSFEDRRCREGESYYDGYDLQS